MKKPAITNLSNLANRYFYLDCWIEVFIEPNPEKLNSYGFTASVELPDRRGVISSKFCRTYQEALSEAEEIINLEIEQ